MAGSSLTLSHVELVVPKPEFDFLQAKAQAALSFAVQLAGMLGSWLMLASAGQLPSYHQNMLAWQVSVLCGILSTAQQHPAPIQPVILHSLT